MNNVAQLPAISAENEFLTHTIHGVEILIRKSDGYCYATAMCKAAEKLWSTYYRSKETQDYLQVVSKETGIPISKEVQNCTSKKETGIPASKLIQIVKGRNHKQGTWIHPDVALHLAQWLSPEVAYGVTKIVKAWMTGEAKQPTSEQKQIALPAPEPKPVTTITTIEPGKAPQIATYEGRVMIVPLGEYKDFNEFMLNAFHNHHMAVMTRTTELMEKCVSTSSYAADQRRKAEQPA